MSSPLELCPNGEICVNQDRIRRWCLAAIKLLILAVVFWFVHRTIIDGLAALDKSPLTIRPAWIVLSGVLYLLGLLPAAVFWRRLLRTLGQDARPIETLRAYYIGHLGKYVPGKAMVVVLRAGLIRGGRVDTTVAAVTVFYETLMMMSVGAFWACAVLVLWYRDHALLCILALCLMTAAGLPVVPPVFRRLARIARVGKSDPSIDARLRDLGPRSLVEGFAAMTVCWFLLAAS
ncbi:MAG TPA: hypothetical protein DD670_04550, partial [Planctomycetaceae bacterium]|nr:hypothetical protein [Planctomycetaceae bacterium]